MNPTVWAMLAAAIAIGAEYLYRTLPGPWLHYLWAWIPMQLFIGYAIYRLVTTIGGQSLIAAFVVWSFCTIIMRVALSVFILHDKIAPGTWAAVVLIIAAKITQQVWK
jgi:multidrug transporter EmrE-like cation transporter